MNTSVEFVDYQEALSILVGKAILAKGFDLASCSGMALNQLNSDSSLGILHKDPEAKPLKYLFGLIIRQPRRAFLGTIWFSNEARGATEQNWILEAYGRKYIELVRNLADELASTFQVKITLRLVREQPDTETYMSDYDM